MRFRSKPLVALSVLLILAGAMSGWHAPDDRDDDAVVVVHHHGDHNEQLTTAAHPEAPAHCAFCHWLRTLGNGAPVTVLLGSGTVSTSVRQLAFEQHVHASDRLALPSRAPPRA